MEEAAPCLPDSTTLVTFKERQQVIEDICKQGGVVVVCETVVTVFQNDSDGKAWEVVDYGIPGFIANGNELIVCVGDYASGEIVRRFHIDSKSNYRAFEDHFHVFSSHKESLEECFGLSFADISVAKKVMNAVRQLTPREGIAPPNKRQKMEEEGDNGVQNDKEAIDDDWVIIEREDVPPEAREATPPPTKEDTHAEAEEATPPQAKEDAPPEAKEDVPPQSKEDAPPEAKEDVPPQSKEDVPPEAKEDASPEAKDVPSEAKDVPSEAKDVLPEAKEDVPHEAKDVPPEAKEVVPPEGEEEVDVPFGFRKSSRRRKLSTEQMEISAPTDFKHVSHVGSETPIIKLTAAISGAPAEPKGEKEPKPEEPPEPAESEIKQPPPPPPPLRERVPSETKVPPPPIIGVNLPQPPPISDHEALLQEVVQFDRTKLRHINLEEIARTNNMPDSQDESISLHSLLKSGLDKMRGKLQLTWQFSRMASITSNGAEEGFDDFDFPLFED